MTKTHDGAPILDQLMYLIGTVESLAGHLLGVSTRRVAKLGVTQLSKSQVSEMAKTLDARVADLP